MQNKVALKLMVLASLPLLNLINPVHAEWEDDVVCEIDLSLFMLGNFLEDSPEYAHLGFAVELDSKNAIGLEFITWKYTAPLGIPYGPSLGDADENYPGYVRDVGLGLTYKRYITKGLFTKFHATPLLQTYTDADGDRIQQGFQLFVAARVGYRWTFANERFYVEPSIAATSWPIRTNVPDEFAEADDKWPGYFLFEPGLNVGFRF